MTSVPRIHRSDGLVDRARSLFVKTRALAQLAPHVLEIRAGGHANAALLLARHVRERPGAVALLYEDDRYTWAELNRRANQWARFFESEGVGEGDVVALVMDNRPEYVFALLGASKLRSVTACLNTYVSGAALAHALGLARPRLVVVGSEHTALLPDLARARSAAKVRVHEDRGASHEGAINAALDAMSEAEVPLSRPLTSEPMSYLYTSGTTGMPKAAIVTNQRFLAASYGLGKVMHDATPEDVIYVALPLYHGTAQWGGFGASLATGATLALRRKFSASSFWSDAVRFRATRMMYIGELCRYLLHQPETRDEKRHLIGVAVGNGLRPDVWPHFQKRFGIPMIREFYGATEGNAPLANLEGRPGMLGTLGPGQRIVRCDLETGAVKRDRRGRCTLVESEGEVGLFVGRISRIAAFDGYVDAKATEAKILRDVFGRGDAWFNTGDLLRRHEGGWVSFADRVGDTFRFKGENVSTAEVAALLGEAPCVDEVNVYGVNVPGTDGRAGMASLRVSGGFDLAAFARHASAALPKYARPIFVRLQAEDTHVTSTLKYQKADYRREGFDPSKTSDALFALIDSEYVAITDALYAQIQSGAVKPG